MKMEFSKKTLLGIGILSMALPACQIRPQVTPDAPLGLRVVGPGDTLYSIAREARLEVSALALMNQIAAPYTIYPGQSLRVSQASAASPVRVQLKPIATAPSSSSTQSPKITPRDKPVLATRPTPKHHLRWQWPVRGRILQSFSEQNGLSKGIDIAGRTHEPISAAAGGTVVYQGNALKAYGNLVIIKHAGEFLSAYAHIQQVKVKEGELVKAGQVIATMGRGAQNQAQLHFEIRYQGKPVDPLRFLPQ